MYTIIKKTAIKRLNNNSHTYKNILESAITALLGYVSVQLKPRRSTMVNLSITLPDQILITTTPPPPVIVEG